jgi:CelD/BcsL family acetyltransferase involved in cellulose biosynthesis
MGYQVNLTESEKTPLANLVTDWETYIANLPKKYRHELRRKLRRLESTSEYIQYEATITDNNVEELMKDFFSLMSSSKEDKETFLISDNKLFFIDIARELSKKNQFKLFFMEIDKKKIAACICFDYDNKYLLYNSGYDPEFSNLSVSLLNKALSIKDAIEKGKSEFNFLKGVEKYKYHLGASDYSVFDLIIRR